MLTYDDLQALTPGTRLTADFVPFYSELSDDDCMETQTGYILRSETEYGSVNFALYAPESDVPFALDGDELEVLNNAPDREIVYLRNVEPGSNGDEFSLFYSDVCNMLEYL